jgi:ubiquitin carboxyl-terminal hydrolase L3
MGDDALRELNDTLRKTPAAASGPWLALESNPEVFTSFAKRNGLPAGWCFRDVLGLDPELLAMTPKPVAAVILLFPCTRAIYAERAKEKARTQAEAKAAGGISEAARAAFHLEQVASFGNACGTIAAIHALTNVNATLVGAGAVASFKTQHMGASPRARGQALLRTAELKSESDGAAAHEAAQTSVPARDGPDLDHHYCAWVPIRTAGGETHVVELDGTKWAPVDHGVVPPGAQFLDAVARVVRERFIAVEPGSIEFSLMALCPDTESP